MRFGLFRRAAPRADDAAVRRIKHWVAAAGGLAPGTPVAVNEIVCTDPSCPGIETVALVMEPGRRSRAYTVPKALAEVTEQDIREALSSAGR